MFSFGVDFDPDKYVHEFIGPDKAPNKTKGRNNLLGNPNVCFSIFEAASIALGTEFKVHNDKRIQD